MRNVSVFSLSTYKHKHGTVNTKNNTDQGFTILIKIGNNFAGSMRSIFNLSKRGRTESKTIQCLISASVRKPADFWTRLVKALKHRI